MMDRTTEEVVNSITITEGPVTNMSLAIPKTSRTPYSDATKVSLKKIEIIRILDVDDKIR